MTNCESALVLGSFNVAVPTDRLTDCQAVSYVEGHARAHIVSLKQKNLCHLRGFKFTVVRVRFNGFKILVMRQFTLLLNIKYRRETLRREHLHHGTIPR
jgi:hypothetical protein